MPSRRLGDPVSALRAARDAWEYAVAVGARMTFGQSLSVAFFALTDLERWEDALPLEGFAARMFNSFWGAWADDQAEALQGAEVAIGPERVDTLTRDGAALDDAGALAFARAAAAAVVGDDTNDEGNE
jgi:hypothetical protein